MYHVVPEDQHRALDFWTTTLAFELRHDAFGWWSKVEEHKGNWSRQPCVTGGRPLKEERQ
jgi:hypothetical protein